jgi:hypothetical protein
VFIRLEGRDAKTNVPDFVYVNTHIINKKITSLYVDPPRRKSYGELSSTR